MSDDGLADERWHECSATAPPPAWPRCRRPIAAPLAEVIDAALQQAGRRSGGVVRRHAQAHPVPAARCRQEGAGRMSALDTDAEILKLAHQLGVPTSRLDFLAAVPPADLRALRGQIGEALFQADKHQFSKVVAVSKVVPTAIAAKITEHALSPLDRRADRRTARSATCGRHGAAALRAVPGRRVGGDGPEPVARGDLADPARPGGCGRRRARPPWRVGGDGRLRLGDLGRGAACRDRRARRRATAAHRVRPRRHVPPGRHHRDADRRAAGRHPRRCASTTSCGASWTSCWPISTANGRAGWPRAMQQPDQPCAIGIEAAIAGGELSASSAAKLAAQ